MRTLRNCLDGIRTRMEQAAIRSGRKPEEITLVAVSKRVPVVRLQEAMAAGQLIFGENYLQEATDKIALMPEAVWHFIGGIQSNKVRSIAEHFPVVETVDRPKIARALESESNRLGKVMTVYLQVNIGREPQKSGVLPEALEQLVGEIASCPHLHLAGLMAMPPDSDDPEASRGYFREMKGLADSLLARGLVGQPMGLSMGMSMDFEIAIEEGATLVRVGSALFGERG